MQHLYHKTGCQICGQIYTVSKGEKEWLDSLDIPDDTEHRQVILEYGNKRFRVDGINKKTIYEYLGDFWHGNPNLYLESEINILAKKSYGDLYRETFNRFSLLEKAGYKIIYMGKRMAKNKKIIPFWIYPFSWGMKGKTRELAQAEYELEGYDLSLRLLEIHKDEYDIDDYNRKLYDLKLNHEQITRQEYNRLLITLIKDEKQKTLATLELDHADGKVTQIEYDKQSATIRGEPWVNVLSMNFDKNNSLEGNFELDWNDLFVENLKASGYNGPTPDNVVNQWFMEVCKNIALEEFDGTGDFTPDSEANMEAFKQWSSDQTIPGRKIHK